MSLVFDTKFRKAVSARKKLPKCLQCGGELLPKQTVACSLECVVSLSRRRLGPVSAKQKKARNQVYGEINSLSGGESLPPLRRLPKVLVKQQAR